MTAAISRGGGDGVVVRGEEETVGPWGGNGGVVVQGGGGGGRIWGRKRRHCGPGRRWRWDLGEESATSWSGGGGSGIWGRRRRRRDPGRGRKRRQNLGEEAAMVATRRPWGPGEEAAVGTMMTAGSGELRRGGGGAAQGLQSTAWRY